MLQLGARLIYRCFSVHNILLYIGIIWIDARPVHIEKRKGLLINDILCIAITTATCVYYPRRIPLYSPRVSRRTRTPENHRRSSARRFRHHIKHRAEKHKSALAPKRANPTSFHLPRRRCGLGAL